MSRNGRQSPGDVLTGYPWRAGLTREIVFEARPYCDDGLTPIDEIARAETASVRRSNPCLRSRVYDVVDRRRLGRLITNRAKGKKSRASKIEQTGRYRVNIDGRTGEVNVRACDTIQELIDKLKGIRSHRALVAVSNEFLLPE